MQSAHFPEKETIQNFSMCKKAKHAACELVKHIYLVLDSNQTQWMTIINKKKGIPFYLVSSCFSCKEKYLLPPPI